MKQTRYTLTVAERDGAAVGAHLRVHTSDADGNLPEPDAGATEIAFWVPEAQRSGGEPLPTFGERMLLRRLPGLQGDCDELTADELHLVRRLAVTRGLLRDAGVVAVNVANTPKRMELDLYRGGFDEAEKHVVTVVDTPRFVCRTHGPLPGRETGR